MRTPSFVSVIREATIIHRPGMATVRQISPVPSGYYSRLQTPWKMPNLGQRRSHQMNNSSSNNNINSQTATSRVRRIKCVGFSWAKTTRHWWIESKIKVIRHDPTAEPLCAVDNFPIVYSHLCFTNIVTNSWRGSISPQRRRSPLSRCSHTFKGVQVSAEHDRRRSGFESEQCRYECLSYP